MFYFMHFFYLTRILSFIAHFSVRKKRKRKYPKEVPENYCVPNIIFLRYAESFLTLEDG